MYTVGNKGDKGQGKFKAIDINNLYKGTSVTPQKPTPGMLSFVGFGLAFSLVGLL
jgi:BAT2 N-terminus